MSLYASSHSVQNLTSFWQFGGWLFMFEQDFVEIEDNWLVVIGTNIWRCYFLPWLQADCRPTWFKPVELAFERMWVQRTNCCARSLTSASFIGNWKNKRKAMALKKRTSHIYLLSQWGPKNPIRQEHLNPFRLSSSFPHLAPLRHGWLTQASASADTELSSTHWQTTSNCLRLH